MTLQALFEAQRFFGNPRLQAKIEAVYDRYLAPGAEIPDEELDVSAAGAQTMPVTGPDRHGDE